jgi:2-dehydropantoate 2-reductase
MRIAVFGVGGVGGYFGGRLAHAGKDVVFIARGGHLEAMLERGLEVESPLGDFRVNVDARGDTAAAGPADAVIVAVKAWQVPEAAEAIRPMLGPDTIVVPVQNGVEAAKELAGALGAEHVLSGLCGILSRKSAPGRITHEAVARPFIAFKEMDNSASSRVEDLRKALDCDGFAVRVPGDIDAALWSKLMAVSPAGAVGAAMRVAGRHWRALPEGVAMYREAVMEVFEVARARGVAVDGSEPQQLFSAIDSVPVEAMTSMQRDILMGRPSELEAQVGAVHRLGAEAGAPTPVYSIVYRSLLPSEMRARGQMDYPSEA